MSNVVAFDYFFDKNGKHQKWIMDQMHFDANIVVDHLDDNAKKWARVDSNLNQSETFLALVNLLHDRGAHLTYNLARLQPHQVSTLFKLNSYQNIK